jgi:serine/threonine-protein kinase
MIGKTLSHYKVPEKIGQGGMGEVYRAEDTNLSREVAIKVLPEQFTKDPQRLARFEREAKLLASLNHPNIAAIHSFEHADEIHFLVLELVPGDTLQERVAKGPVPVQAKPCKSVLPKDQCQLRRLWKFAAKSPREWKLPMKKASSTVT